METISHKAKVVAVEDGLVTVEIISESACSACHAKSVCSMGDSTVKTVQVNTPDSKSYTIGEDVEVLLGAGLGHKAVLLAYVIPLIILVGMVLLALALGVSEGRSALVGFYSIAFYYIVLYLFRKKIGDKWKFTLRKY